MVEEDLMVLKQKNYQEDHVFVDLTAQTMFRVQEGG